MKNCPTCQTTYPNNFMVCPQDGVQLVEAGTWADGAVIRGKYRIIGKVGQGGMGAVYKVVHEAFDELRALKVINPGLMDDELFVKRFKHEAKITRKLQHPNAVRVDDIDEAEDGRPFIVMEYIEGQSLKKLIQDQGALPPARVCAIIKQAAAALEAAHGLEMVHRDIKPDNIVLISAAGGEQVKVLDFGIAKVKEARAGESGGLTLTGTGVVIGTPQYMSPEQAMGKRGDELDGRSDIYSLGVVMYELLSGDLPFKADTTMAMLLAHMQTPPTPIRMLHPELSIPEPIANVVMRTLEKNPDLRPQSARALIAEIENAERAKPVMSTIRVEPAPAYSPDQAARAVRESLLASKQRASAGAAPKVVTPPALEPPPVPPLPPTTPHVERAKAEAARPGPPARREPAPPPRPAAVPAPARKPAAGMWVVLGAVVVALVLGGVYFVRRSSTATPANSSASPAQSTPSSTAAEKAPATSPATEPAEKPQSPPESATSPTGATTGPAASQTPSQAPPQETQKEAPAAPATPQRISVAGQAQAAKLIFKPKPQYPPLARAARIQGEVRLEAIIGKDGTIQDLKAVSGPELLRKAAMDAVARWRYQPTVLNGEPVEVVTPIEINFTLSEGSEARPSQPAVDPKKIEAAIKLGDFYYGRGEYDNAINEYDRGLNLDPTNATLRDKIDRTRKAKAAESRVLQQ